MRHCGAPRFSDRSAGKRRCTLASGAAMRVTAEAVRTTAQAQAAMGEVLGEPTTPAGSLLEAADEICVRWPGRGSACRSLAATKKCTVLHAAAQDEKQSGAGG